jgi:ribosomal protein S27AE
MSNPNGPVPPKAQPQIDLTESDTIQCVECGNASFIPAFFLKKISALVSPTGQEAIVPIQVYSCGNCGIVPQKMLESSGMTGGQES